jgi:hypothetical protein
LRPSILPPFFSQKYFIRDKFKKFLFGNNLRRRFTILHTPRQKDRQADPALRGDRCGGPQKLDELLTKGNTPADLFGDSAYRSTEIEGRLRAGGFKSRIHLRATRNHSLSEAQANANRNRSKIRQRILGTIGIVRARAKIGLQNLAYNIRRLVTFEQIGAA